MECTIILDEAEWNLIIRLLNRERTELNDEIHHTDKREYRQGLHERLDKVDGLLERLKQPVTC
jgi:hypothetical protein